VGLLWDAFFWRTQSGLECDLVLSSAGRLVPVEIKHAASIGPRDLNALHAFLDDYPKQSSLGVLISLSPRVERLSARVFNVPLGLILNGP
jgi:hypothetical protein